MEVWQAHDAPLLSTFSHLARSHTSAGLTSKAKAVLCLHLAWRALGPKPTLKAIEEDRRIQDLVNHASNHLQLNVQVPEPEPVPVRRHANWPALDTEAAQAGIDLKRVDEILLHLASHLQKIGERTGTPAGLAQNVNARQKPLPEQYVRTCAGVFDHSAEDKQQLEAITTASRHLLNCDLEASWTRRSTGGAPVFAASPDSAVRHPSVKRACLVRERPLPHC